MEIKKGDYIKLDTGEVGKVINISSDLDGRTRRATKYCSTSQFPNAGVVSSTPNQYPTCKPFTDETRASHPAWMYRDLEHPVWEEPIVNPQANLEKPFQEILIFDLSREVTTSKTLFFGLFFDAKKQLKNQGF